MNFLKDLFTVNLIESTAASLSRMNIFDLRTKDEFSFLSIGGLAILVVVVWLLSVQDILPIVEGCGQSLFGWTSCDRLWATVVCSVVIVGVFCVFIMSATTCHNATNRYINNLIWIFLVSSAFDFGARRFDYYRAVSDLIAKQCQGTMCGLVADACLAFVASAFSVTAMSAFSLARIRLSKADTLSDWSLVDLAILVAVYLLGSTVMVAVIFRYTPFA